MNAMTYDEILVFLCDEFDKLIAPKTIKRTNTNIIFLLLKSIAKGYELINNICVLLSYKFNPALCSDEDLESTAKLVGTQKILGKGSSLAIFAQNSDVENPQTLPAGTYTYQLDVDTFFTFTLNISQEVAAGESASFIAISNVKDSVLVTAQQSIVVTASGEQGEIEIPESFLFSCEDNSSLQGYPDESTLAFRQRILTDQNRIDIFNELQLSLRNLPTIFDVKVVFNPSQIPTPVGSISLPGFNLLLIVRGNVTEDFAKTVVNYGIFPTFLVDAVGKTVYYKSASLAGEGYPVNYIEFTDNEYTVDIELLYDTNKWNREELLVNIQNSLVSYKNPVLYNEYITEDNFYTTIKNLNLVSVQILDVKLKQNGTEKPYIQNNPTQIGKLTEATINARGV